ncbi:hypothetical protein [Mycobacteroides saopaulense]|uniref:Uncharacterized protein n=1 Tax=Mycobacteroides saopaulense TaxID=1578165 RepID=A0A1X0IYW3_9MYCO|nr:hypothetical protein [Mycobacteroides saopaulense]OHT81157.1 hypothetical protein BKG68_23205 [Mycobacteroides saopaulense]OHU07305.1 hypothetical protein BKG73_18810 [Mycobacteroides saopaulense]ORB54257.1 hypothetical protein BST43_17195 [Mycobacteroides saopaulense]
MSTASTRQERRRVARLIAATAVCASLIACPPSVARADNCSPGDFGAAQGCAPPAAATGGDKAESWPPTNVDWPPEPDSDTEAADQQDTTPTPIVMPDGAAAVKPATPTRKPATASAPIVTPGA